ncbi:MAG: phosphate-starvation-inducible PsiE family protein [Peptostreptococcus sp.]|uniref:phosphate-starvation-inducible PsiE family protein n=1 Tax=Peptostreptococcus sp. TaxID=1262 RepID=UPI002FCBC810
MKIQDRKKTILKIAYAFETILALVILIAVLLGIFDTLRIIYNFYIVNFNSPVDYTQLNQIFAQILLLVIGVEIAVMLTLHVQTAVLEVLLFGIARKMLLLPKNNSMLEILLGVIAIGGLFLIKKYLTDKKTISEESLEKNEIPDEII